MRESESPRPSPDDGLADGRPLTERGALGWLPHTCFLNGPPGRIGIELEQILTSLAAPGEQVAPDRRTATVHSVRELVTSKVSQEPGGQLELSTPPADDLTAAVAVLEQDAATARKCAAGHGLRLTGWAADPYRAPRRVRFDPRYTAMEAYFDRSGNAGRLMMCSTASVQVNVEAGGDAVDADTLDGVAERRWALLHEIGPALVAAFANSPLHRGRPTGWVSYRQAIWAAIDPARTRPVRCNAGESLAQAWARWCLDAPLLLVRRPGQHWLAPAAATFRDWIRGGDRVVPDRAAPTVDDLAYHLTTLFPPVRARGHFEVRYLDTQPQDWWRVPVAVVSALVDDETAGQQARQACAAVTDRWLPAARHGVHDPLLHRAAGDVLALAAASLNRSARTSTLGRCVEDYLERWTLRARCPADDMLEGLHRGADTGGARADHAAGSAAALTGAR